VFPSFSYSSVFIPKNKTSQINHLSLSTKTAMCAITMQSSCACYIKLSYSEILFIKTQFYKEHNVLSMIIRIRIVLAFVKNTHKIPCCNKIVYFSLKKLSIIGVHAENSWRHIFICFSLVSGRGAQKIMAWRSLQARYHSNLYPIRENLSHAAIPRAREGDRMQCKCIAKERMDLGVHLTVSEIWSIPSVRASINDNT